MDGFHQEFPLLVRIARTEGCIQIDVVQYFFVHRLHRDANAVLEESRYTVKTDSTVKIPISSASMDCVRINNYNGQHEEEECTFASVTTRRIASLSPRDAASFIRSECARRLITQQTQTKLALNPPLSRPPASGTDP